MINTSRKDFIKTGGLLAAGILSGLSLKADAVPASDEQLAEGPYMLPKLPYAYDALSPHIDARTMEIHHTKHHQAYITKLNAALDKEAGLKSKSLEQLLSDIRSLPESVRNDIRNQGGGHWNHSFFWTVMNPKKTNMSEKLSAAIKKDFGSEEAFKEQFEKKAASVFGSGWAWLVKDISGHLSVVSTPNQDNPLMDVSESKGKPLLGVDVWEHAYYLNYQNRRPDYLKAFWQVVNWQKVSELYEN
jgi:superoxide dismutase, Fe-Mn family